MTNKTAQEEIQELTHRRERAANEARTGEEADLAHAALVRDVAKYSEDRDLVNQLIGQVQMAEAVSKFTTVVGLTKLKYIKENKLYRALKGKSVDGGGDQEVPTVGTWDGFCRAIGTSANKVDEDLANLRAFGEEALENLNRIGAGYRELRKLRKLPEEEREMVLNGQVVNLGDREAVLNLIDDLSAKHAKEKEKLEKKAASRERELEVKAKDIERKDAEIARLHGELDDLAGKAPGPDELEQTVLQEVQKLYLEGAAIVGAIQWAMQKGSLEQSTLRARLAVTHLAEYLERSGAALRIELMNRYHEDWSGAVPGENEVAAAQEAEQAAAERLDGDLAGKALS